MEAVRSRKVTVGSNPTLSAMVSLPAEKIRHVFRTPRCGAGPRCRKGVCLMKNVLRSTLSVLATCLAVALAAPNAAAAKPLETAHKTCWKNFILDVP